MSSINKFIKEIKNIAKDEGIVSFDEYMGIVDGFINDKVDSGELNPSEDIESIKENLLMRWEEVEQYLARKTTKRP